MTVLAFVLFVIAVVVMVVVHRQTQRRLAEQLLERERELNEYIAELGKTQNKQAKVFVRELARTKRQADRMIDEAHSLHQTVHGVINDPRVQRLLNEGKTRRG